MKDTDQEPKRQGGQLDQRRAHRDEIAAEVELVFSEATVQGTTADLSEVGTLMTIEDGIEFEVRCDGKRWRGRLVRCQPVAQGRNALAIEFVERLDG